jgi:hypothetical protein
MMKAIASIPVGAYPHGCAQPNGEVGYGPMRHTLAAIPSNRFT